MIVTHTDTERYRILYTVRHTDPKSINYTASLLAIWSLYTAHRIATYDVVKAMEALDTSTTTLNILQKLVHRERHGV